MCQNYKYFGIPPSSADQTDNNNAQKANKQNYEVSLFCTVRQIAGITQTRHDITMSIDLVVYHTYP